MNGAGRQGGDSPDIAVKTMSPWLVALVVEPLSRRETMDYYSLEGVSRPAKPMIVPGGQGPTVPWPRMTCTTRPLPTFSKGITNPQYQVAS